MSISKPISSLQNKKLLKLLRYIFSPTSKNTFYKKKLSASGIKSVGKLGQSFDFFQIPWTTKKELLNNQLNNPPFGTNCTKPLSNYKYITSTSGSTFKHPLQIPLTIYDVNHGSGINYNWLRKLGVNSQDCICFLAPPGLFYILKKEVDLTVRASVLAINQHAPEQVLLRLKHAGTTVICSSPSELLVLAESSKRLGWDLKKDLNIRLLITTGEAGGSNPFLRTKLEKMWGASLYDELGTTENGLIGVDCDQKTGIHLLTNQFIFEVINPITGFHSDQGELVITNLQRRDFPLIRYRTGDFVKLNHSACDCGQSSPRLQGGVLGRVDQTIRIGDQFFHESELDTIIRCTIKLISYQVILLPQFKVEIKASFSTPPSDRDLNKIKESFYRRTGREPKLTIVDFSSTVSYEWKKQKFIDQRLEKIWLRDEIKGQILQKIIDRLRSYVRKNMDFVKPD